MALKSILTGSNWFLTEIRFLIEKLVEKFQRKLHFESTTGSNRFQNFLLRNSDTDDFGLITRLRFERIFKLTLHIEHVGF